MIEKLINKAPCGLFCFADDGTLLDANETFYSTLNYTRDYLQGKNVETIFTIPTRIFFQTHFYPLVKMHGRAEEIFLTLLTDQRDHLPVLLNATQLQWEHSTVTLCAFIVVPNRKKFEDEIVNARNAAERALKENTELIRIKSELETHSKKLEEQMRLVKQQNNELKQFNHVFTHNLKEPLRKMLLYSGQVQAESDSKAISKLIKSSEHLRTVVSGLQEYVWLSDRPNKIEKVNLQAIIDKAVHQLHVIKDSGLLEITVGNLHNLQGDAAQLQLLFYHLLLNAIEFRRGDKATVSIESTIIKRNSFRALENRYSYEDYVRIEVIDYGQGFNIAYKDYIFELFRKLHFTPGHGVGLAICRKIAENHYGYIEADSVENSYTKISVWLPVNVNKDST